MYNLASYFYWYVSKCSKCKLRASIAQMHGLYHSWTSCFNKFFYCHDLIVISINHLWSPLESCGLKGDCNLVQEKVQMLCFTLKVFHRWLFVVPWQEVRHYEYEEAYHREYYIEDQIVPWNIDFLHYSLVKFVVRLIELRNWTLLGLDAFSEAVILGRRLGNWALSCRTAFLVLFFVLPDYSIFFEKSLNHVRPRILILNIFISVEWWLIHPMICL